MSETGPCAELERLLWQFMDREVDEGTARRLRLHVRRCHDCGSLHDFETRLRAIIQQKCGAEPLPEDVRRRLLRVLQEL